MVMEPTAEVSQCVREGITSFRITTSQVCSLKPGIEMGKLGRGLRGRSVGLLGKRKRDAEDSGSDNEEVNGGNDTEGIIEKDLKKKTAR